MELEGVVHNGVIVLNGGKSLTEGTRVRINVIDEAAKSFGERFAGFKGSVSGLPADLAERHHHYRLGNYDRDNNA